MTFRAQALALLATLPVLLSVTPARASDAEHAAVAASTGSTEAASTRLLPGGALLHLSPGTRIEVGRTMKLQLGPPGSADTLAQVVKLSSGRVEVELPLSRVPKTAVLFQAPHKASAVAKGGHSIAIVDTDRVTFAAVDGSMLAASGDDWRTLPSGIVRSFVGSEATPEEHAVPGAPTLILSHPLTATLDGQTQSVAVDVGEVAESDHYELSFWRVTEKGTDLARRVEVRAGASEVSEVVPGHYEVSARAIDARGVFGKESVARPLRVVGAQLPSGARFTNGVMLLGPHGRVKLLGVEGMEVSYGAAANFMRVPMPYSVGLSRGEGAVVRLREPGAADALTLGLEPRKLRAEVAISPKQARWPEDKIEVSIRLFDARGREVPQTVNVKATVLVNIQPIQLNWVRSGNLLTAQVPTSSGPGPWVVRVEVADEFGDAAGRDFLEVAGSDTDRVSAR